MAANTELHKKIKFEDIVKAFKEDCITLLFSFSEIINGKYMDFINLWRKQQLGLCSVLLKNLKKISHINIQYLEVAKDLLFLEGANYKRIGALYLLYTIFNKQDVRCGNRIRLNIHEFKLLTNIICELYEEGHEEARYIYASFDEKNAFDFMICNEDEMRIKDDTNEGVNIENELIDIQHLDQNYKENLKKLKRIGQSTSSETLQSIVDD